MRALQDYDQSLLWARLDELSKSDDVDHVAVDHLKASVRKIAKHASWISAQVCRFMPQYTLHEERHFLNVLGICEALLPDGVIARLTPLECALPILAAYTHDLGMALSQEEHDALLDESTDRGKHFASYRTRFDEELRQLERWRNRVAELQSKQDDKSKQDAAGANKRIDAIEGHILASYLRDTHTEDDQIRRLRHWLEAIKRETGDDNLFRYGNFDYQRPLALIGISHGRGAPWLRRQLIDGGPDDRFFQPLATGESANLAFPGLLLRLADVMDFDASRAPRILFKHFGIENDQSVLEWNKHLSIVGWRLDVDPYGKQQPDLLYSAECQHPVHEKAIREFKTWIDAELSAVRIEADAQRRQLPAAAQPRYDLHLPSQTRLDIRPARDPLTDQPKYVYHDLQFRLDQDEIQQLLMGESLYGDPGLCIRELLQNALDALELRELRLKLKQKGEAREPVDGELIRPGWVREPDGREEELRVTLDWGTDEETGQQWLRVTDNGVGMTEEVIKNYFAQIGKSYYRSPEFNQERAAMKAVGEVVSPISIFGIGIMSCFMIAERLSIRTCPASFSTSLSSRDVTITGPGSLFWLKRGTLQTQGTEVTLFLKPSFQIEHNSTTFVGSLRNTFTSTEPTLALGRRTIDVPLLTAEWNCWPKYPIIVSTSEAMLRIDDRFHFEHTFRLDTCALSRKAEEWSSTSVSFEAVTWTFWEWNDYEGPNATGSRLRLWYPSDAKAEASVALSACAQHELAAFIESQLPEQRRTNVLVRGMRLPDDSALRKHVLLTHSVGTFVWIDLRGDVAPRLTVARNKYFLSGEWKRCVRSLFQRMSSALRSEIRQSDTVAFQSLFILSADEIQIEKFVEHRDGQHEFDFTVACETSWGAGISDSLAFTFQRFLQFLQATPTSYRCNRLKAALAGQVSGFFTQDEEGKESQIRSHARELTPFAKSAYRLDHRRADEVLHLIIQTTSHDIACTIWGITYHESRTLLHTRFTQQFCAFSPSIYCALLQETFFPSLEDSWPFWNLDTFSGNIANATLSSPANVNWDWQEGHCRVIRTADASGEAPSGLVERGYDLTFPMTAVPLGQLRRECGEWRSDRWYRPLGVAPFLLPALDDVWPAHAEFLQETFKVPHIYCMLPRFELWSKRFSDWTDADWHDPENLSALWDLSGHLTGIPGQVLWARGTHDIHEMPKIGLPAPQFLEENS